MTDATRTPSSDALLFPACQPANSGMLPLDRRHTMHWEVCGNPAGVPLVFIHGGPGGGSLPHHRRFFDPAFWRIVLYDQRGAGRSTPVADVDRQHDAASGRRPRAPARAPRHRALAAVRRLVGLDAGARLRRQRIRDACWASCCAASSSRRRAEIDWFMHGMRNVFPEAWRAFAEFLPPAERGDLLRHYYAPPHRVPTRPCTCPRRARGTATKARARRFMPRAEALARHDDDAAALAIARIEAHYFVNDGFLADGAAARRRARGSATCPARSCRAATTSSARRSPPTRWRGRGRRPSTSSCPTPAIRCASPASRASSSTPWDGCRRAVSAR